MPNSLFKAGVILTFRGSIRREHTRIPWRNFRARSIFMLKARCSWKRATLGRIHPDKESDGPIGRMEKMK